MLVAMVVTPLAAATGTEVSETDVGSTVALKDGRADEMSAWSVDSGGGESSGGDFSLTAAIGQPDAGLITQCGTVLAGGLWAGAVDLESLFCNGFESGGTDVWSSAVGGTL